LTAGEGCTLEGDARQDRRRRDRLPWRGCSGQVTMSMSAAAAIAPWPAS